MHAASWLNLEVQPSSSSEHGLAHLLGRFFYQHMSGFDHQLINLIDNLRCEKTQVILDRLSFVRRFVLPASMPEHLPDRVVMVGQLMDDGLVKSLHPHNGLKTNGIQDESA